jgi:hypothetical protein
MADFNVICERLMVLKDDKTNLDKYVQERRVVTAAVESVCTI